MTEPDIIHMNIDKTAIVARHYSDGDETYSVYSMGSDDEIAPEDINSRAVCFTCSDRAKAILLAAAIEACCE